MDGRNEFSFPQLDFCFYSQIRCSVAGNIAILSCNIDRLIAPANCNRREQIAIFTHSNILNRRLQNSKVHNMIRKQVCK